MKVSLKDIEKWEKKIREDIEKGRYKEVPNMEEVKRRYERILKAQLKEEKLSQEKDRKITLRISGADLSLIKAKASELNIPYQTLIRLVIREYAKGRVYLKL